MEHLWQARWRARTDLLWLCKNVLEYTLVDPAVHGPMIAHLQQFPRPSLSIARGQDKILDNGKFLYTPDDFYKVLEGPRKRCLFFSRGYFKTSVNTIAHTIQWLLNYPQMAIADLFSVDKKAQDILKNSIKFHFQFNQKLRELFPDYCPQKRINDWGNSEAFVLANRDDVLRRLKLPPRVEPSVMAQSLDKGQAGYHFDVIKCSDIVEENNVQTPEQRAQVKKRFGLLPKMLVKRPDGLDGWIDLEGTFYHTEDLHADMVKEWRELNPDERRWSIFINGVFQRETGTATPKYDPNEMLLPFKKDANGKRVPTWPTADPIEKLEAEEKDPREGGWNFFCTPGHAEILYNDWTSKPIQDVQIGDEIVGFDTQLKKGRRRKLQKTKVLDKGSNEDMVYKITTDGGGVVYSTIDHLWFNGRVLDKTHHTNYSTPAVGRRMVRVYKPLKVDTCPVKLKAWAYLSGIIDGEGHIDSQPHSANITIAQSLGKNTPICNKIEATLETLDIDYNTWLRQATEKYKPMHMYWLVGGRPMKLRMLANMDFAKRQQLIDHLWLTPGAVGDRKAGQERIISIEPVGKETVYWLTTGTGNYVSQGYASKNCQRVLDPWADSSAQRPFADPLTWITREDFQKVPVAYHLTTIDLADTTGPKSNPSVITTAAYDRMGRCYVHDIQRGKWNPDETVKRIFQTWAKFRAVKVVIEDYGYVHGLRPTIDRYGHLHNLYPPFHFQPASRTRSKVQQITRALQPPFHSGDMRFVDPIDPKDPLVAKQVRVVLENEFSECTVQSTGSSDDILDTLANQYLCREWFGKENLGGAHTLTPEAEKRLEVEQYQAAQRRMFFGGDEPKEMDLMMRTTGW